MLCAKLTAQLINAQYNRAVVLFDIHVYRLQLRHFQFMKVPKIALKDLMSTENIVTSHSQRTARCYGISFK